MLTVRGALAVLESPDLAARGPGAGVRTGDVVVRDGVVVSSPGLDGADQDGEVLDAQGCVVTPGLVNAHHHLLQTAFRTLPGTREVPMREWLPTMAAAYARAGVDPELGHAAARAGLAEALLCGVTTVADHHLTWPSGTAGAGGGAGGVEDGVALARATVDAATSLGARLVFVRGSARDDPQTAALSAEAIAANLLRGNAEGEQAARGGITPDGMLQVAVGPAGVHSDARETFALLGEVAARFGLRRRTQANEQVDVEVAADRYGRRPLDLLQEWGWLAPDVTLAHLCGITADELDRLVEAGVTATHAPGCDLPMGWGVAPVAALLDAGVPVGLGTSGGGSNDAGHLLADARLAMQVAPLAPPVGDRVPRPLSAAEVLALATTGSAAGLGRLTDPRGSADATDPAGAAPPLGHLRPGAAADLCVWDVSGVADAGVADPVAGLLWASPGRRPRHVVVAGRVVVRDHVLVSADEHAVAGDLRALLARRLRT